MSDRMAVMSNGRIEQVGSPADVYERPATSFVAGFVGVSNTLHGEAARQVSGSGEPITVRPEKIRMLEPAEAPGPNEVSIAGRVHDVVYLGATTRYVVRLEPEGTLVVVQQNLTQSSMEALEVKGRPVRLAWDRQFSQRIRETGEVGTGSQDPGEEGE